MFDLLKLTEIINELQKDPGKFIADKLADPNIGPKVGEAISKLPPEALEPLAKAIAKYLPAPELPTAEAIAESLSRMMPEGNAPADVQTIIDNVKGQIAGRIVEDYKKLSDNIMLVAQAVKKVQDDQPALIQATVEATFKANANALVNQITSQVSSVANVQNQNPNFAGAVAGDGGQVAPPQRGGESLLSQLLTHLPTIIDAWQKLNPQPNANLQAIETGLRFYTMGLQQGNKLKTGDASTGDAAKDLLTLITPQEKK